MFAGGKSSSKGLDKSDPYNPAKKDSLLKKYDLESKQMIPIAPSLAQVEIQKNLEDPRIGPEMKRLKALERELAEFEAEEPALERDQRKANLQVLLYAKYARAEARGELTDSDEHTQQKEFLQEYTRQELEDDRARKQRDYNDICKSLSDMRSRITALKERIASPRWRKLTMCTTFARGEPLG